MNIAVTHEYCDCHGNYLFDIRLKDMTKKHPTNQIEENREILFYQTRKKMPFIKHAEGVFMWDHTGKDYMDACSGAVISNIGHGNPRVLNAIQKQAENTFFAYRLQFENQPAMDLAGKLVQQADNGLDRVFFVSGGSEAVESAMKLCRQYYYRTGRASRHVFISRTPSYHGCTLGALALTGYAPLEAPFRPLMQTYPKIPAPFCFRCAFRLTHPDCDLACAHALEETILAQGPENVAAFVAEPVGGASTGAAVPPDGYFDLILAICDKYDIMLILDEVMTGYGRTGTFFGYEHWHVEADIIALSKGMASGYYPLGAVMTKQSIVHDVLKPSGFAHGFTYAGNPMACAVGLEVLNIILDDDLCRNAALMGNVLKQGLHRLAASHEMIGDVRGLGLLLGVELTADRKTRAPFPAACNAGQVLVDEAHDEGLIIYTRRSLNGLSGDHILVSPPLVVNAGEIDEILIRLDRALTRTKEKLAQTNNA